MASIGMNQRFAGSRTFTIAELQHGHQLAVLKGVLVFLAILFVGGFTMLMPTLRPAFDASRSVPTNSSDTSYIAP
jgi:hypothetical protein